MNEIIKVIKERHSCRSFIGKMFEKEKIETIVEAGLHAPSAMNQQPWKIVVVTNKALIDEMNDVTMDIFKNMEDQTLYERMMSRGGKVFYNAPCLIVIAQKEGKDLDTGIVCENIALAASSLGIGSCICGLAGIPLKLEKYKEMIIPEGYEFGVGVLLGIPTETKNAHDIDVSKVVYVK